MHEGLLLTEWSDLYSQIFKRYRTPSNQDVAWSTLRTRAEWRADVAYERAAGAADGRCRQPLSAYAMRALQADMDAFTAAHAGELRSAEKQWAQLRSAQQAAGLS